MLRIQIVLRMVFRAVACRELPWLRFAVLVAGLAGLNPLAMATAPCEQCHHSTVSFAGAKMDHTGIAGNCARCHNGILALGKAPTHIPTTQPCEECHHSTVSFLSAGKNGMNHASITSNCARCHNGVTAKGKEQIANHIPTTLPCEQCHRPTQFVSWAGAKMDHTGIVNRCASCHGGGYTGVTSKIANHIPTAQDCSLCHLSTTTFAQWRMDHTGITSNCKQCHGGIYAGVSSKPTNHIPVSADCEVCHSNFITWAGAIMKHSAAGIPPPDCNFCHEAGRQTVYLGITANDVRPTSGPFNHVGPLAAPAECDLCHRADSGAFLP